MIFPRGRRACQASIWLGWAAPIIKQNLSHQQSSTIQPQYQNQYQDRNLPTMMLRNLAIAAALCVSSVEGFAFSPVSVSSQVEVDTLFCLKYMSRS